MSRTDIEIDDEVMRRVLAAYGFPTRQEAVDVALRSWLVEPMDRSEALALRGSGWPGDLAELRDEPAPRQVD